MVNEKTYKGQTYDYDYMMEAVKIHPELKKKLENAKEKIQIAKSELEEARFDLEDVELEWHNHISEWEGFPPFEDKLNIVKE